MHDLKKGWLKNKFINVYEYFLVLWLVSHLLMTPWIAEENKFTLMGLNEQYFL